MPEPTYKVLPSSGVGGVPSSVGDDTQRQFLSRVEASALDAFAFDPVDSFGLYFKVRGGAESVNGAWVYTADSMLTLADDATNYVEKAVGAAPSLGDGAFTAGNTPLYAVLTAGGQIVNVLDRRPLVPAGTLLNVTLTLTPEEVHTLNGDMPELIAAPGADRIIVPRYVRAWAEGWTRDYGEDHLCAFYEDMDPETVAQRFVLATCLAEGADAFSAGVPTHGEIVAAHPVGVRSTALTSLANKALKLWGAEELASGIPTAYTIDAAGTGYQADDTITLDDGAVLTVLTVGGGGEVLTFEITTPATEGGYFAGDSVAEGSTSGGGSNFAAEVSAVAAGDGTVHLSVDYEIVDVS